jgi:endonuclease-3
MCDARPKGKRAVASEASPAPKKRKSMAKAPSSEKPAAAKSKSPPAAKSKSPSFRAGSTASASPPAGWEPTYRLIEELRADRSAVVDTMGSEAIHALSDPENRNYQALISLMLSSQTKDTVNQHAEPLHS